MPSITANDFLDTLAEVTETPRDALSMQTALDEIPAWDSLSMVMFLATVDDKYGVQLKGSDVAGAKTVQDLHALIV